MAKMTPRTLSGFMELLPAPQQQMERIMEILRRTYSLYGFTPLDTPVIESSDVLLAKAGGETEKQIYRFQKGDSDLSLRFDLTVPLAKYVALHYNDLSFPFRRYQIGKVYRGERAQRGRFREFYQADIDIIGDGKLSIINEAEIPAIIYKTFSTLGLKRFQIRVNNRKILNGFYASLGLAEQSADVMRTVDKLDKIGPEKVKTILVEDFAIPAEKADEILRFIAISGSNEEVLSALEGYQGRSETFDAGLEELKTVVRYLADFGVPAENFAVDLSIARGLDYYTGTVYETTLLDHPEIGSVCSGGRYDNLAEFYTDRQLPGAGISCFACSEANMAYMEKLLTVQVISFDKVNQQRHVLYLKDKAHTLELMKRHAAIMGPKFRCVLEGLNREIAPLDIASWRRPKGGYFVSLNAMPGTAKRTLALCKEAGVTMTGAGATFPYGKDPEDSNIRIAPSLPPVAELEQAVEVLCTCLKLAALEKLGV